MKNKYKLLLRTGAFGVLIVMLLGVLSAFFNPVWNDWSEYYTIKGFYEEPSDTVETLFLGSSVSVADVAPMELYKEHGICAYSLSTAEQPVIASYYLLQEAYRFQSGSLKNVFFEVSQLRDKATDATVHKAIDYMKLSSVKIKAVADYCNGDFLKMLNYLCPVTEYHSRWTEMELGDIEFIGKDPVNGARGYDFATTTYRAVSSSLNNIPIKGTQLNEEAEEAELKQGSMTYFEKIVEFCEKHDLNLVLVKLPAKNWDSSLSKAVSAAAESHGLEFYDFNFDPVASQLNYIHAFDSRDGRHANIFGALKITEWIGNYIVEECEYTDVRGNEKYAYMEEQQQQYDKTYYRAFELTQTDNIADYLSIAMKDDNSIVLTVKEDVPKFLPSLKENWQGLMLPVIILLPFVLDYLCKDTFFTERLGADGAKYLSSSILLFIGGVASVYSCLITKDKKTVTPHRVAMMFADSIKTIVPSIAVCLIGYMIGAMFKNMDVATEIELFIESMKLGKLPMVIFICILTCLLGMIIPGSSITVIFGSVFISSLAFVGVTPLLAAAMLPCICGVMCGITPPLGLGMYAGMSISGADFNKTFKNNMWWVVTQFILEVVVLMGVLPVFGL